MSEIGKAVTGFLVDQLQSETGINVTLAALRKSDPHSPRDIRVITTRNIAAELMEKANQAHYPAMLIYCEKLTNALVEKFRTFSGTARMSIELRNSDDRLEALDTTLIYVDMIRDFLDSLRGEWMAGVSYNGGYEVVYSPVRQGGKHFLQTAKVTFEVDVSN